MLIVFEGADGSGKTTQSKLLYKYLKHKGLKVILTKEPTKGPIGRLIRKNFLYSKFNNVYVDAFLFAADTYSHIESVIKPSLAKDVIVISDRYFYSNLAYQGAEGLSLDYLVKLHENTLKPDVVFLLDCDVDTCMKRLKKVRRSKYETRDFLSKVRNSYLMLKDKLDDKIILLNSSECINDINNRIIMEVEKLL
ncbi:putative thymidylate kinase [Candidatus Tiddalikarchaeum anstoanum]|nr:putative thymidylate kinase [Candidatus Tiddalikarchaeum anstoanum]